MVLRQSSNQVVIHSGVDERDTHKNFSNSEYQLGDTLISIPCLTGYAYTYREFIRQLGMRTKHGTRALECRLRPGTTLNPKP